MKKSKGDIEVVSEGRVYELGFVFAPTIPEEKVGEAYEALKTDLIKRGAEVISEEAPVLRGLAYEMTKVIANKNINFSEGYFGWVKFNFLSDAVADLENVLREDAHLIRYLLIKTVKENTLYSKRSPREVKSRDREEGEKTEGGNAVVAEKVVA